IQTGAVDRTGPLRLDTGPGDGEPVGVQAEPGQQVQVLLHPVVVIAGHIAGVAVPDPARSMAEGVPDARATPVLPGSTFHLVGGGGRAQGEAGGQWARTG